MSKDDNVMKLINNKLLGKTGLIQTFIFQQQSQWKSTRGRGKSLILPLPLPDTIFHEVTHDLVTS